MLQTFHRELARAQRLCRSNAHAFRGLRLPNQWAPKRPGSFGFSLPSDAKIVELLPPAADAAGRTSNYITLKFAHKAWIVCHLAQGNAAQVTFTLLQGQDVSGTNSITFDTNVPIWANQDTSTSTGSDTLVVQTAGSSFQCSVALKNKIVVFEIDPSYLNEGSNTGYKTIAIQTSASNASNVTEAMAYIYSQRYAQATPPSVIAN